MRYIVLVLPLLLLAACGSSRPAASPAHVTKPPVTTGPECARQVRFWLAQQVVIPGTIGVTISVRDNAGQVARIAENYRDSGDATTLGRLGVAAANLTGFPVPGCADPGGYWNAMITDAQAAPGESDASQAKTDAQYVLNAFADLNTELGRVAPGTQISEASPADCCIFPS